MLNMISTKKITRTSIFFTLVGLTILFLAAVNFLNVDLERSSAKVYSILESVEPIKPNENIKLKESRQLVGDLFSHTNELHWSHMPITYNYDECITTFNGKMKKDIENALAFISDRTDNAITFKKIDSSEADIIFICDIGGIRKAGRKPGFLTYAEALPYVYKTANVYDKGEIYIYSSYECLGKRPTLIIHEVLHLFGLEHNVNPSYSWDIMHPYERVNCDADILDKDIEYLKEIYG